MYSSASRTASRLPIPSTWPGPMPASAMAASKTARPPPSARAGGRPRRTHSNCVFSIA
jgi:hypothetical protein